MTIQLFTSPYFKSVTPSSITPDVISLNQGFGSALAINDGLIIVGSPEDDPGFTDAGSVYAYEYTPATCLVTSGEHKLNLGNATSDVARNPPTPNPSADQKFGYALAINKHNDLVVGIPGDNSFSGAIAVYKFDPSCYYHDFSRTVAFTGIY